MRLNRVIRIISVDLVTGTKSFDKFANGKCQPLSVLESFDLYMRLQNRGKVGSLNGLF